MIAEEDECFVGVHFLNVRNVAVVEFDFEDFVFETAAFAGFAGDKDVGEELHLDALAAKSRAGGATSATTVIGKIAGLHAQRLGGVGL